jgi:hypothetical protein
VLEDLQPLQATGGFIRADFPNHPLLGTRLEKAMSDAISRMSPQIDDRVFRFCAQVGTEISKAQKTGGCGGATEF